MHLSRSFMMEKLGLFSVWCVPFFFRRLRFYYNGFAFCSLLFTITGSTITLSLEILLIHPRDILCFGFCFPWNYYISLTVFKPESLTLFCLHSTLMSPFSILFYKLLFLMVWPIQVFPSVGFYLQSLGSEDWYSYVLLQKLPNPNI